MRKKTYQIKKRIRRPAQCYFCTKKIEPDYKDIDTLKHFITERGKIMSRLESGVCQKHQRIFTKSVKRARFLALLPYVVRPI